MKLVSGKMAAAGLQKPLQQLRKIAQELRLAKVSSPLHLCPSRGIRRARIVRHSGKNITAFLLVETTVVEF